jgi:hypothetical protein
MATEQRVARENAGHRKNAAFYLPLILASAAAWSTVMIAPSGGELPPVPTFVTAELPAGVWKPFYANVEEKGWTFEFFSPEGFQRREGRVSVWIFRFVETFIKDSGGQDITVILKQRAFWKVDCDRRVSMLVSGTWTAGKMSGKITPTTWEPVPPGDAVYKYFCGAPNGRR